MFIKKSITSLTIKSKVFLFKGRKCLLDVMSIDLQNMDLYAAVREDEIRDKNKDCCFKLGSYVIMKKGSSLLTDKCHLKIQVERNLDSNICHNGKKT